MSRTVIPPGKSETIISSSCDSRRLPVGTRRGVNVPLRSLGMRNSTSPAVVPTVFGNDPFLQLPCTAAAVLGQLGLQPPLGAGLDQLLDDPAVPVELHLARVDLREQIIQHPGLDQTL